MKAFIIAVAFAVVAAVAMSFVLNTYQRDQRRCVHHQRRAGQRAGTQPDRPRLITAS